MSDSDWVDVEYGPPATSSSDDGWVDVEYGPSLSSQPEEFPGYSSVTEAISPDWTTAKNLGQGLLGGVTDIASFLLDYSPTNAFNTLGGKLVDAIAGQDVLPDQGDLLQAFQKNIIGEPQPRGPLEQAGTSVAKMLPWALTGGEGALVNAVNMGLGGQVADWAGLPRAVGEVGVFTPHLLKSGWSLAKALGNKLGITESTARTVAGPLEEELASVGAGDVITSPQPYANRLEEALAPARSSAETELAGIEAKIKAIRDADAATRQQAREQIGSLMTAGIKDRNAARAEIAARKEQARLQEALDATNAETLNQKALAESDTLLQALLPEGYRTQNELDIAKALQGESQKAVDQAFQAGRTAYEALPKNAPIDITPDVKEALLDVVAKYRGGGDFELGGRVGTLLRELTSEELTGTTSKQLVSGIIHELSNASKAGGQQGAIAQDMIGVLLDAYGKSVAYPVADVEKARSLWRSAHELAGGPTGKMAKEAPSNIPSRLRSTSMAPEEVSGSQLLAEGQRAFEIMKIKSIEPSKRASYVAAREPRLRALFGDEYVEVLNAAGRATPTKAQKVKFTIPAELETRARASLNIPDDLRKAASTKTDIPVDLIAQRKEFQSGIKGRLADKRTPNARIVGLALQHPEYMSELVNRVRSNPEALGQLKTGIVQHLFKRSPTAAKNYINKTFDSLKQVYGEEGLQNLQRLVSGESPVGKVLLTPGGFGAYVRQIAKSAMWNIFWPLGLPQIGAVASGAQAIYGARQIALADALRTAIAELSTGNTQVLNALKRPASQRNIELALGVISKQLSPRLTAVIASSVPRPGDASRAANDNADESKNAHTSLLDNLVPNANANQSFFLDEPIVSKTATIPDKLVESVIKVESENNPKAVSSKGARGLMQVMPATFKEWASKLSLEKPDIDNPEHNVAVGSAYLKYLMDRFDDLELALAAYNAGPNRVQRLLAKSQTGTFDEIKHKLPAETRAYVPKVLKYYA